MTNIQNMVAKGCLKIMPTILKGILMASPRSFKSIQITASNITIMSTVSPIIITPYKSDCYAFLFQN